MTEARDVGPVAEFCAGLRQLQLSSGASAATLARRLQVSRSQLHAILHGQIKRPPDWSALVEPFVRACTDDEQAVAAWRQRHAVLVEVYEQLRRQPCGAQLPAPCLLPPPLPDFTGRAAEQAALLDQLAAPAATAVVSGPGGVGKTTLAVAVAYRLRDRYPDGQLYVDLRGTGSRLDPYRAQGGFLRRLGVPAAAVPDDPAERADLWRTLTADRRLLVVLDNAADEDQVRGLLPGPAGGTLVTSRSRLAGLDGAGHVPLGLLPAAEATALLGRIVGAGRLRDEPGVADRVVAYCGLLPLAVRVAGGRLLARPGWPVAHLADQLADERRRFDRLRLGDRDVRVTLALSYRALSEDGRRAFRLLGLLRGHTFAVWVLGALLERPDEAADELLGELVGAHLVEPAGVDQAGQLRYRLHDLMWLLATELVAADDPGEVRTAVGRLGAAWQARIVQVARLALGPPLLPPERRDALPVAADPAVAARPIDWFAAERTGFVAAVELLAAQGLATDCWLLAHCAHEVLECWADQAEWQQVCRTGLAAARAAGDRVGEGYLLYGLASTALRTDGDAVAELGTQAAAVLAAAGDSWGEVIAQVVVAEAAGVFSRPGWPATMAAAVAGLHRVGEHGWAERLAVMRDRFAGRLGPDEGVRRYERVLRELRAAGSWRQAAIAGRWLAHAYEQVGELDRAETTLAEVMAWCATGGDLRGTLRVHIDLGRLRGATGDLPAAERHLADAVELSGPAYDGLGRSLALTQLARLRIQQHRPRDAAASLDEACTGLRALHATRYLEQAERLRSSCAVG